MSDLPFPIMLGVLGFAKPEAFTAVRKASLGKLPGGAPVAALVPAFNQVMACFTALFALLTARPAALVTAGGIVTITGPGLKVSPNGPGAPGCPKDGSVATT